MPRKKFKSVSEMINDAKSNIENEMGASTEKYIPDIITFCESDQYLAFKKLNMKLRPLQRIILKIFYRGSKGNENLKLTDEEIELCKKHGLDSENRGSILQKYNSGVEFRELVLVWGRRSGKDFLSSIIATYEAMRLMECDGGDPYKIYKISTANEISILTVANSKEQAATAFKEVKDRILLSEYFKKRIGPEGIEMGRVYLLTPQDIKNNQELIKQGFPPRKGSLVIEVGHSNSDALRGKQVFVLILDEVAMYKQSGGSSSGEQIYTAMTPSLNTYHREIPVLDSQGKPIKDENGKDKVVTIFDSKIVSISSPKGEDGIFYKLFMDAPGVKDRLACKAPTWIVNTDLKEQDLRDTNQNMSEDQFNMEFGAEFSGTGGESFFPRKYVEEAFTTSLGIEEYGKPGKIYFAHLDPASTSHNYSLAVVHRENFVNNDGKPDFFIVVDHIHYWYPSGENAINVEEVDEYMLNLKKRFYFGLVTYDQWNSERSIALLRRNGVPSRQARFTHRYENIIYTELYNLVIGGRIKIPPHKLLRNEMLNLQRRFTPPSGFKVYPKSDGEVCSDDIVDAVAGACYLAITTTYNRLPSGKLVQLGNPSGNARMWQSMSGPLGYGYGQQVANKLESRNSWPNHKR